MLLIKVVLLLGKENPELCLSDILTGIYSQERVFSTTFETAKKFRPVRFLLMLDFAIIRTQALAHKKELLRLKSQETSRF